MFRDARPSFLWGQKRTKTNDPLLEKISPGQAETIDPEIFFQEADRLFLSVSVPKEMMDAHLETFIKIQALRANPDQRDMAGGHARAVAVLRELSSALNSL